MTFYNDTDPQVCAWLSELTAAGHLTAGVIDERPIQEIDPKELSRFTRVHLFAGIGGWDYALRLAGWPVDVPVWTGSCPCQPFSCAGKRQGTSDKRHLWPFMRELIAQRRPPVIFGEQVASEIGREWFAGVRTDLEALGYAVGGADLCAAGVGASHIRQRLYWVAHNGSTGLEVVREQQTRCKCEAAERSGATGGLVQPTGQQVGLSRQPWEHFDVVYCRDGKTRRFEPGSFPLAHGVPERVGRLRGYGNAIVPQVVAEFIQAFLEVNP